MATVTAQPSRIPLLLTLLLLGLASVQGQAHNDEVEEDGWGMWSDYTECSRSCGGGVQTSSRRCMGRSSRYPVCQGHSIQYQSCNTRPCPAGSMNYRAHQCRSYNGVTYSIGGREQTFSWTPYYKPKSPCRLICVNEFGDTKELRRTVVDGTHCDNGDRFGVCISGVCKPVGCDHRIGSVKAEDNCLVCGGTGERCETFRGSTLNQVLQADEATEVIEFPAGATKIRIGVSTMSPTVVDLESSTGRSLTLSEAALVFGKRRMAEFAGTMFSYSVEEDVTVFSARGPLNDTLSLTVRFEGLSPLVKYQYSIKRGPQQDSPELTRYQWAHGGWTSCSKECGVGYQLRRVTCMDLQTGGSADLTLCPRDLIPDRNKSCSNGPCRNSQIHGYKWVPGRWGECSESCGVGEHTREMQCVESGTTGDPIIVSDELCSRYVGAKPVYKRACQGDGDECPYWATGPWNECSVTCGYGRQTRRLYCQQDTRDPTSPPIVLQDNRCKDEDRPEAVQLCQLNPCPDGSNSNKAAVLISPTTLSPVDCVRTRYGCCPDQITPAKGYNYYGCVDRVITSSNPCEMESDTGPCAKYVIKWYYNDTKKDCLRFWYGGCEGNDNRFPDRHSCKRKCANMATNPGLPTRTCQTGRYGCCDDGITFARGPDKDGCPERNRIGGCAGTRHGCCRDGITSARGPNKEGCPESRPILVGGCAGTRYGCCDDKVTAARGLNKMGCPETNVILGGCRGTRYGCCADGVSAARGENYLGCPENPYGGCASSAFGCCNDKVTFAQGPDMRGCPESKPKSCQESRYGCCPDQVTEASMNQENCAPFDTAWCGLPKDPGNCTKYKMEWRFDVEYGICRGFWYGGCFGNANRFTSKAMCEAKCMHLEGKDICKLPVVKGPCKSIKRKFHFDAQTGQCQLFNYGGCRGNKNNFDTRERCQAVCGQSDQPDVSVVAPRMACASQPCQNGFTCQDYRNGSYSCSCNPDWGQNCEEPPNYWCFSDAECGSGMKCVRDRRCNDGYCHLYSTCAAASQSYTCDIPRCPRNQDCINDDTFENGYFCIDKVQYDRPRRVILSCRESRYGCCPDRRTAAAGPNNYGCGVQRCQNSQYGCCRDGVTPAEGPAYEGCELTDGSGEVPCEQTVYGCCDDGVTAAEGPGGRGCELGPDSEEEEEELITTRAPIKACTAHGGRKLCTKYEVKWRYDPEGQRCKRFWWGGCADNGNVFGSSDECESRCINKEPEGGDPDFVNICDMEVESGPCYAQMPRFYYNKQDRSCQGFVYGGCRGNENNFRTMEDCQRECMDGVETVVTTQAPVPDTVPPPRSRVNLRIYGDREVDAGSEFKVECQAVGRDQVQLEWTFNGGRLPVTENLVLQGKSSVMSTGYGQVAELKVLSASQENAGVYTCRSSDGQEQSLRVEVRGREVVTDVKNSLRIYGDREVEVGSELKVECHTMGRDQVQLKWTFNGDKLADSENLQLQGRSSVMPNGFGQVAVLRMLRASPENSGVYTCSSSDGQEQSLRVEVRGRERPPVTDGKNTLSMSGDSVVQAGTEFVVGCTSTGPIQVRFDWFYNGQPIRSSENIQLRAKSAIIPGGYSHTSEVVIARAGRENAGTYYCRTSDRQLEKMVVSVRQTAGVTDRPVRVTERPATGALQLRLSGESVVKVGDELKLSCSASGPREVQLEWYFNGRPLDKAVPEAQKSGKGNASPGVYSRVDDIIIPRARQENSGTYYCRIVGGKYERIVVTVKDEVRTTEAPVDVESSITMEGSASVAIGETISIRCRGAGPRRPTKIEWYINGKVVKASDDGPVITSSVDPEARNALISTLEIADAQKDDSAAIYCRQFPYGEYKVMTVRVSNRREPVTARPEPTVRPTQEDRSQASNDPKVVCSLRKEIGPCKAAKQKWFHDHRSGTCKQFTYGGCQGNNNNFDTQEECENFCTAEAVCDTPKYVGRCRAAVPRYYFDAERKECLQFIFGGCNAKPNNFESQAACEQKCAAYLEVTPTTYEPDTDVDVCQQNPDKGTCRGYNIVWYYSPARNRCSRFIYTGCDGNGNRFDTEDACTQRCLREESTRPPRIIPTRRPIVITTETPVEPDERTTEASCVLNQDRGRCANWTIKWYYDNQKSRCMRFYYGGCGGNTNRFDNRQECVNTCVAEKVQLTTYAPVTRRPTRRPTRCQYTVFGCCPDGVTVSLDRMQSNCRDTNVIVQPDGGQQEGQKVIASPGSDVVLTCSRGRGQDVTWYRDGFLLSPDSSRNLRIYNNATLVIRGITERYTGDYSCKAFYGNNDPQLERFTVEINVPLRILPGPALLSLRPGEDAVLHCQATGNPSPRVTWTRDGRAVNNDGRYRVFSNGTLIIANARQEDAGDFECSAQNGVGEPARRRIKFSIRESIEADIQRHSGTYMEGDTITLLCNGRGYPTPRVEWIKEGKVLSSEGNIFVRGGELQVRSASIEDSGLYTCAASNGRMRVKDHTTVHVKTHTADTKCSDSMGKYKCLRIVASRLCYVNPFRQTCCDTCRRKGFRS